jgi:glycosyltransferase involved in cell wall biosynthesis
MTNLISVVIPCFNSANYLRETVASVLAQSYQAIEIILVDDGSTDTTSDVIAELISSTGNGKIHTVHQTNGGSASARNLGISLAQGDYILPLDADDCIHPAMLTECAAILNEQPTTALVYTDRQDFGDSNQRRSAGKFELARLKYFNQLSYCALYRRSLWQMVGGYKSNVSGFDDWDFWLAAAICGAKAYHLPEAYLLHRRHPVSQLWCLLPQYETLYARIILNNAIAFTEQEQYAAREFLAHGTVSTLLSSSRFLFLNQYYTGYPTHLQAPCVS